ncbi:MAG TPA: glycosyltransferase family 2 protein, partial [Gemmatirosa sp.]|nr:glycosyltransferase family 2 protein [Gemmatirosa sp.]
MSVIIACYNRAEYVGAAIESALAQTHPPHEIIVVDDQSTDGSVDVVSRYPVRLLHAPEKLYAAGARNLAASVATGELIAILDSDDLWLPSHLEHAVAH